MDQSFFDLILSASSKNELADIISSNDKTADFGLVLNEQDAKELLSCRKESLKKYHRIEFGKSILDLLIYHFGDSPYINQNIYLSTLEKLQDIFYEFKNLTNDKVSDEELLLFMEEQFNGICCGDLEYLESTCLVEFADSCRNRK